MSKLKSNKIEKMLKAFYAKMVKRIGRLADRPGSSADKFANYQEHIGKGLTLEVRERDLETSNQDFEVELQKLKIKRRKVRKQLDFALKAWEIHMWIISTIVILFMIFYPYLPK